MTNHAILPFLLGTLYSRIVINESDHLLYGVKALFPEPKGWVPRLLQKHFGGSMNVKDALLSGQIWRKPDSYGN